MRIAIITANIGGIDQVRGIPKQTVDIDFHYYHENNLPFPLPNLGNRLRSKYIKIQTHRFLPDYDAYIWIDGSIDVTGINFTEEFLKRIENFDIAIYKHAERKNVYDEMNYILGNMGKGNDYLTSRYIKQDIAKELEFYYLEKMPINFQLFSTYTFARWNNAKTNDAFNEWWRRCVEFSNFDQSMFSYIAWKHELNINNLEYDTIRTNKLFERLPHIIK